MYFKDLDIENRAFNVQLIKIGWLDNEHVFNIGPIPKKFIDKLKKIKPNVRSFGYHKCPFCNEKQGSNRYVLKIEDTLQCYDAPDMIIHYIEDHNYLPPQEFIDHILKL
jgi:hypothetical protein